MATATVVESSHLSYRDGSSDKEYHIYMCDHGGTFTVHAEYGRRGSVSQRSEKGTFRSRLSARDEFWKLESAKRAKGYDVMTSSRPPIKIPLGATVAPPPVRPVPTFDAALVSFNAKLARYVKGLSVDELTAGRTATARVATAMGVSSRKLIEGLPSYTPLVALLGAIAFASEDYTDDAVKVGIDFMSTRSITAKDEKRTVALLPVALTEILTKVLAEFPRTAGLPGLVHHLFKAGRDSWSTAT